MKHTFSFKVSYFNKNLRYLSKKRSEKKVIWKLYVLKIWNKHFEQWKKIQNIYLQIKKFNNFNHIFSIILAIGPLFLMRWSLSFGGLGLEWVFGFSLFLGQGGDLIYAKFGSQGALFCFFSRGIFWGVGVEMNFPKLPILNTFYLLLSLFFLDKYHTDRNHYQRSLPQSCWPHNRIHLPLNQESWGCRRRSSDFVPRICLFEGSSLQLDLSFLCPLLLWTP